MALELHPRGVMCIKRGKCVAKGTVCCNVKAKMSTNKSLYSNSSDEVMFGAVSQKRTTLSKHNPLPSIDIPLPRVQVIMLSTSSHVKSSLTTWVLTHSGHFIP